MLAAGEQVVDVQPKLGARVRLLAAGDTNKKIEGACRHLIADRLNLGGARWGLDGAGAVLTIRAVISNGDFQEYWRFHLDREHQRRYPGADQGQYTLGA